MAFCVTDDHARQEQVFDTITKHHVSHDAYNIRRLLTETCVDADDPRARFVGIDAYVAAGGTIMRDLFEPDDGGWLQDPDLLMRLVSEKLAAAHATVLAQGWKWAEAVLQTPYNLKLALRRLKPLAEALTGDDEKRYLALSEEHDNLIEELDDEQEMPADVRARLDAIEAELAEMDNRPPQFAPEDIARGGVLLSVGHNGQLNDEYGFVRPEDALPVEAPDAEPVQADDEGGGHEGDDDARSQADSEDDADQDGAKPLPDRLIQDLTACRTVGLRDALARDFNTAFLAVLHSMCLELFHRYAPHSCLQLKANTHFPAGANGLADMDAAKAIEQRHAHWQTQLPEDPRALWAALVELDRQGGLAALFAHCASLTVNAVREPHQPRRDALRHADRLAATLGLDMTAAGWSATTDNYFARVTKAQILDAVREARGEDTVRLIEHLKKGDMAKEAARLLQGTGWLPEPLRTPDPDAPPPPANTGASEACALPAFLTEGAAPAGNELPTAAE
jgi:ParB family chromosome partitioning protein